MHPNVTSTIMPLVRIITRLSHYPTELVRDLRTRGFDVETCLPPSEQQQTADLEISLDQCSPEGMSESISRALATKDVVIVADANGRGGAVRSIGMVVLSSEENFQASRRTSVPIQFNEIYEALLRERLAARKTTIRSISANWEPAWQKMLVSGNQQLSGTWKYFRTAGKNLGGLSAQAASEAGVWLKSKKSNWIAHRNRRASEAEPGLVPSMFSLSGDIPEVAEKLLPGPVAVETPAPANRSSFRFWKPIMAGGVAILALTVWLHDSHAKLKANQNPVREETAQQTAVPAVQVMQKNTTPVAKILAKSTSNGDDDSFQDVVVRHFEQPAVRTLHKDDGVKRRVVVD